MSAGDAAFCIRMVSLSAWTQFTKNYAPIAQKAAVLIQESFEKNEGMKEPLLAQGRAMGLGARGERTGAADYRFLLLLLVVGAFFAVYYPVWRNLIAAWTSSEEYSYGFLIVPLSAYLAWSRRAEFAEIPVSSSSWGLALVVLSLLLYVFASHAEIVTVASCSMILVVIGAMIYLCGITYTKRLSFPALLLFLMIPVPAQIYSASTVPLQLFVTKVSVWLAQLMDIPVYREGNTINLPGKTLQVVHACSGLRSMMSLMTLSIILGYLTLRSNVLRALLFFCGIPAAILVNIVRVVVLTSVFYYFQYDLTAGTTHTVFGILVFSLALAFIFQIKRVFAFWDKSTSAS